MDALSYKTAYRNKSTVTKEWLLVDAENQIVGRLASKVAMLLRGKHRTDFTPHADAGSNVIIINADKVRFTGKKMNDKQYIRYTGYQGGQRFTTPKELIERKPTEILTHAIHRILPKNRLGRVLNTNVRIFAGTEHGMEAQKPRVIDINEIK